MASGLRAVCVRIVVLKEACPSMGRVSFLVIRGYLVLVEQGVVFGVEGGQGFRSCCGDRRITRGGHDLQAIYGHWPPACLWFCTAIAVQSVSVWLSLWAMGWARNPIGFLVPEQKTGDDAEGLILAPIHVFRAELYKLISVFVYKLP